MVGIEVVYEGGLRTRAVHGPSGAELRTDAPADNGGKGEDFSPTDLVATALATCMLTIMGKVAERHGIPLAGARALVEKQMVSEPARRIGRLAVRFTLPDGIDEGQRKLLERAALTCPVHKSLHPDIEIPIEWA
jgi:putative redox protein